MITYSIEFTADIEMAGPHAHPPVLTNRIRPNLVVAGNYCLCFITETAPSEGIEIGSRGSFKAMGVCTADIADLFVPDGKFELRAGPHIFATGAFRTIDSRKQNPDRPPASTE
ncbi:hypothetical protein ACVIGB_000740 [Bradyrhizobium sp. USDA 4341]